MLICQLASITRPQLPNLRPPVVVISNSKFLYYISWDFESATRSSWSHSPQFCNRSLGLFAITYDKKPHYIEIMKTMAVCQIPLCHTYCRFNSSIYSNPWIVKSIALCQISKCILENITSASKKLEAEISNINLSFIGIKNQDLKISWMSVPCINMLKDTSYI